jgi:hypothetical protein
MKGVKQAYRDIAQNYYKWEPSPTKHEVANRQQDDMHDG